MVRCSSLDVRINFDYSGKECPFNSFPLSLRVDRERHSSFVCNISSFLLSSLAVSVLSSSTSDIDTRILATLESKRRRLLPFQFFNLLRRPNEGIEINRRTSPAPPPSASSSFNLVQRNEETHWWWR